MIRFSLLLIFFLSFQCFASENDYKLYKIIELKKNELEDAITSIPLIGDIKDEINLSISAKVFFVIIEIKNFETNYYYQGLSKYKFDLDNLFF